jgi:hypothetical protein
MESPQSKLLLTNYVASRGRQGATNARVRFWPKVENHWVATFLGGGTPKERGKTMAKTYRDVAIDQMIATVEEALSCAIDWWGKLPTPMNEAIDKFRVQLGAAIDSVEFEKKRSTGEYRNRQRRPLNSDEDWLQDSTQNGDNNRALLI